VILGDRPPNSIRLLIPVQNLPDSDVRPRRSFRTEQVMFKRVIVPLDGSRFAERALPTAKELSRLLGAELHLVRVLNILNPGLDLVFAGYNPGDYSEQLSADEHETIEYLSRWLKALTEEDYPVSIGVSKGHPGAEIAHLCRQGDVIVLASHGRGGFKRALLGSVADEIMRTSPVPVLLVRGPEGSEVLAVSPTETSDLSAVSAT